MNKCKKIIALLLAVLFVLPLGVLGVFAEDAATESTNLITADNIKEAVVSNPNAFSQTAEQIARLFDGEKYGLSPMTSSGNASGSGAYRIAFNNAITLNKFVTYRSEQELWMVSGDWAINVRLATGEWIRVAEIHDEYGTNVEFVTDANGKVMTYEDLGISTSEKNHDVAYFTREFTFPAVTVTEISVQYITNKTRDGVAVGGSQHFVEFEAYLDNTVTKYTGVNSPATSADVIASTSLSNLQVFGTASSNSTSVNNALINDNDGINSSNASSVSMSKTVPLAYSSGTAYYQIDFATAISLNKVAVYLTGASGNGEYKLKPTEYAIDVKTADGVWHRVAERHNVEALSSWGDVVREFNFNAVSNAVAVRITAKRGRTTGGVFRISEMLVKYDPAITADKYTGIAKDEDDTYNIPELKSDNFALGAAITSSNTKQFYTDNYPVKTAVDGKGIASTAQNVGDAIIDFALNNNTVGYYEIQFKTAVPVNNLVLYRSQFEMNKLPEDLAVDVKNADGYWVRVAEMHNVEAKTGWDDAKRDFKFETVENAVAVRLSGNKTRGNKGLFRAAEIAVYSNPAITKADYTGTAKAESTEYNIPEYISDNFAKGATASTNSQLDTWDVNRLTDGSLSSTAISRFANGVSWFQANFKTARTINQVSVNHGFQTDLIPQDFAIDVKVNGATTWTRVAEAHNVTRAGVLNYYFAEVKDVVAVRLTAHSVRNTTGNFAVCELEAYYNGNVTADDYTGVTTADDAVIPYTISDNYAIGAEVSNVATDEVNVITNINDGKKAYNSAYAGTALGNGRGYFEFDFAKATTVNQVTVYRTNQQFNNSPKDFAIDVQLADGTWVRKVATYDVERSTDWGQNATTFSFEAVEAVKVRVSFSTKRVKTADPYTHVYFTEIEIFNNPNVTANDYTGIAAADDWKYDILAVDHVKADQDGNGAVDSNDLVASKKTILGVTAEALKADVNGDYVINILDYIATAKEIAE